MDPVRCQYHIHGTRYNFITRHTALTNPAPRADEACGQVEPQVLGSSRLLTAPVLGVGRDLAARLKLRQVLRIPALTSRRGAWKVVTVRLEEWCALAAAESSPQPKA